MVSSADIKELGVRSSGFVAFFDYLASRKRFPADLTLDDASRALPKVSKPDLIAIFRDLDALGLAEFRMGRRGFKTRLTWIARPADVASAWRGELQEVAIGDDSDEDSILESEDFVEHVYQLRRELQVRLELPADLTEKEAAKLARWIETLPFADE